MVGKIPPNRLHQIFHQYWPYETLHTDITQVNMTNHRRGYISAIINGSIEEVSVSISLSPNMNIVFDTLRRLKYSMPSGKKLFYIVVSDARISSYFEGNELRELHKGNCHDNAPIKGRMLKSL